MLIGEAIALIIKIVNCPFEGAAGSRFANRPLTIYDLSAQELKAAKRSNNGGLAWLKRASLLLGKSVKN